jgi:serine/threonine-protein kinase HipA
MAHFDYRQPGVYSYEDAFEVMRKLGLSKQEAIQLFKRMVFNVITRNQDDHTKNISFLMDGSGQWRLSPAYDVTYAYNPSGIWTHSHQMTINGKRENITKKDLLAIAAGIGHRRGAADIENCIDTVQNWETYAEEAGMPKAQAGTLEKVFQLDL